MNRVMWWVAALLLSSCGGGRDGAPSTAAGSSAATTPVQINFGDDPSDRLLAVATVMHIDPVSGLPIQQQVSGTMSTNVHFGTPLVVGTSPMVVNLDMDMRASLGIDAGGNVSMNPAITAHHGAVVAGSLHDEDGGLHGLTRLCRNPIARDRARVWAPVERSNSHRRLSRR
jgi:hypothetical protein